VATPDLGRRALPPHRPCASRGRLESPGQPRLSWKRGAGLEPAELRGCAGAGLNRLLRGFWRDRLTCRTLAIGSILLVKIAAAGEKGPGARAVSPEGLPLAGAAPRSSPHFENVVVIASAPGRGAAAAGLPPAPGRAPPPFSDLAIGRPQT